MATVIDALLITLGVDPKGVTDGMKRAENTIQGGVKNILGMLAPLAGGLAIGKMLTGYLDDANALRTLSRATGLAVEDIQAWQGAVVQAGGSADAFTNTLKSMQEKMGGGNALERLKELSSQFGTMTDKQAVQWGAKYGIDEGTVLLLQKGGKEVANLIAKQKELTAYTKEDTEMAAKAKAAMNYLGESYKSVTAIVGRMLTPALTWLAEKMTDGVKLLRENQRFIEVMAGVITVLMIPALSKMGLAGARAMLPWLPLIALVVGLALVIEDLIVYIQGGKSALGGFWSQFGTGEEIGKNINEMWEKLKANIKAFGPAVLTGVAAFAALKIGITVIGSIISVVKGLSTAFGILNAIISLNPMVLIAVAIIAAIGLIVAAVWWLYENWDDVTQRLGTMWELMKADVSSVGEWIIGVFQGVWDFIAGFFGFVVDGLKNLPDAAWQGAKDMASGAWDAMKGFVGIESNTSPALAQGSVVSNSDTSVQVGEVKVYTQATDARGIAGSMGGALNDEFSRNLALASSSGVSQK